MKFKIIHITICCLLCVGQLFSQHHYPNIPDSIRINDYPRLSEEIVTYYENHGFPFVCVSLQAADADAGDMTPTLLIDTGIFVSFDSIVLRGDAKLSKNFLYPYLGLKRGMPYNEKLFQEVDKKLGELSFATPIRHSEISFVGDKCYLYVYLNHQRTNQFDGYIGLVPVSEQTGKVAVNGELDLALNNLFKIGEVISLHWRSSERFSQYLAVSAQFPYLFRSRFGIEGAFCLDKQDTSYLTLNYHIGLPYSFLNNSYIEPFFEYSSSTILNPSLLNLESDSGHIDYHKLLYGLKGSYKNVDYLFNPRKGFELFVNLSVGNRNIQKNNKVDESLYDGIPLKKTTYRLLGHVRGYIPAGKHFVIAPTLQAGSLLSGPHYYNELFKIGGIGLIRGFNTNDICASTYLLYSAELRYLFGQRSYANLFLDGGVYEQQLSDKYLKDCPFGFGAGVHLAVRAGTFYLEYALGRERGNPISFKTSKIHFGIQVEF